MMLLSLRLEALYTDFILQKLIVNHNHSDRRTLIETSHLILSLVLSSLSQRIVLDRYRIDLEWSVRIQPCWKEISFPSIEVPLMLPRR
jgi:hypothetical protein